MKERLIFFLDRPCFCYATEQCINPLGLKQSLTKKAIKWIKLSGPHTANWINYSLLLYWITWSMTFHKNKRYCRLFQLQRKNLFDASGAAQDEPWFIWSRTAEGKFNESVKSDVMLDCLSELCCSPARPSLCHPLCNVFCKWTWWWAFSEPWDVFLFALNEGLGSCCSTTPRQGPNNSCGL